MFVIQIIDGVSFEIQVSYIARYPIETFISQIIFLIFCSASVFISLIITRLFYLNRTPVVVIMVTSCIISGVSAFFYANVMLTIAAG